MSTSFTLSRTGIIRSAFQKLGVVPAGQDPDTAKLAMGSDALNVIIKAWESKGIYLAKLERTTTTLTSGTAEYTCSSDTLDIEQHTIYVTVSNVDIPLRLITRGEYMSYAQKDIEGVPTSIYVEKTASVKFFLYPVPDATVTSITYPRVLLLNDMNTGASTSDLPSKYLRPLILDLAVELAPHFGMLEKMRALKAEFNEAMNDARQDDTERGNVRLVPSYGLRWVR